MSEKFEQWAVVEIMGHKQFAGKVTEQEIAGAGFIRVDVPETPGRPAFTKLFAPGALYGITPVDESAARAYAAGLCEQPIEVWRLPQRPALPAPCDDDMDDPEPLF